ncbi:MAG TPA: cyclic pyranopterin monophosphate synthase MoaC, partial [Candidatus Manganitrophaceae bacterium]|nr:cyclic pyranopterin monophosphate synthase MoaC [Candidatus Manganitrophaceae bacterium]
DVSGKADTHRTALATGMVFMKPETLERIQAGQISKGDVLAVAQVAGVMGAKRTPDLIPMCHPLLITSVDIHFEIHPPKKGESLAAIEIHATVKTSGQTGVEMEAVTAVCVTALTIYDMCKAIDKGISFGQIGLLTKSGGKSGTYTRPEPLPK